MLAGVYRAACFPLSSRPEVAAGAFAGRRAATGFFAAGRFADFFVAARFFIGRTLHEVSRTGQSAGRSARYSLKIPIAVA
jgi:hypothetical protein